MTTKVSLYYFSGTANTELVFELLQAAFEKAGVCIERHRIEDALRDRARITSEGHALIGIGFPIHEFGTPRIVYDWARALPPAHGVRTFIYMSAGGIATIDNGAAHHLIRKLKRKGYDVFYERIIYVASNWLVGTKAELAKQLCHVAATKTEHTCQEILSGAERSLQIPAWLGLIARLVYLGEDRGARQFGRSLRVTSPCVDCRTCVDNCPMGNIRRQEGGIVFGGDCLWCMRCIYACPAQAIVPRLFKSCVLKGGYDVRRVLADPDIAGETITADMAGAVAEYIRDPAI